LQGIKKLIDLKHPNTTNKMTGTESRGRTMALVVGVATLLLVLTGVAYNNGNGETSNLQTPGATMQNLQDGFTASSDSSRSLQEAEITTFDGASGVRGSERSLKGKKGANGKKGKKSQETTAMPTDEPTVSSVPTASAMPSFAPTLSLSPTSSTEPSEAPSQEPISKSSKKGKKASKSGKKRLV
jgi:hypothetical protein